MPTKSVWNSSIELGGEVVVHADVTLVSFSDSELLEFLASAAMCVLAMINALRRRITYKFCQKPLS